MQLEGQGPSSGTMNTNLCMYFSKFKVYFLSSYWECKFSSFKKNIMVGFIFFIFYYSWSKNPKEWKFQKARQTWLLLHMYDKDKVRPKFLHPQSHRPEKCVLVTIALFVLRIYISSTCIMEHNSSPLAVLHHRTS